MEGESDFFPSRRLLQHRGISRNRKRTLPGSQTATFTFTFTEMDAGNSFIHKKLTTNKRICVLVVHRRFINL